MSKKRRKKKAKNKKRREERGLEKKLSDPMAELILKRPQLEREYLEAVKQLQIELDTVDKLEVLSHASLMSYFAPEDQPEMNEELRTQMPLMHFLTGLCLNSPNSSDTQPDPEAIPKLLESAKSLIYKQSILSMVVDREKGVSDAAHTARLQSHIAQMNPNRYPEQTDRLISKVYAAFDKELLNAYGYKASTANLTYKAVRDLYEFRINERKLETRDHEKGLRADPAEMAEIQRLAIEHKVTEDNVISSLMVTRYFSEIRKMFAFLPGDLSKFTPPEEMGAIQNFLKRRACGFGVNNSKYLFLDSPNQILTHPLIETPDGHFMCPMINELHFTSPEFIEREILAINGGKLLDRLKDIKGDFVENAAYELFCKIFGSSHCHKNLSFWIGADKYEADLLIVFDNRIISVESKSGKLTPAAKRGAPKGLETDLKKLLEAAFEQSRRVFDYIRNSDNQAVFYDSQRRPKFTLDKGQIEYHYFPVSVTLEALLKYATNPKSLQEIGLFKDNEFPLGLSRFGGHQRSVLYGVHNAGKEERTTSSQEFHGRV